MDYLINNNLDMTNIMYILSVFIFLKYGIKELNIIYLLLISVIVVYYFKPSLFQNNKYFSKHDNSLESNIDDLLKPLEKYDNNNLLLKIRKNYNNIIKYTNKNNISITDINDISFLKDKILNYINELNINNDDDNIDNIYSIIYDKIDSLLK